MSLTQFVANILNISEDRIETLLSISQSDGSIVIKLKLCVNIFSCPYCKGKLKIHGYSQTNLRHSVVANKQCNIVYMRRRYYCKECKITISENNPFCNTGENITFATKANILEDLKNPGETYSVVAQRYNVSVTTVIRIFDKHVNLGRKAMPEVLSMDEHYFPNSDYDSLYCVLLMDFKTGEIVDVLPSRKKLNVTQYFSHIKYSTRDIKTFRSELDNIKYVSIDLYDNFRDVIRNLMPEAIICADSFHVLKHLTEDFDKVRKNCIKSANNEQLKLLLMKFKYIFRHNYNLDKPAKYNKSLGRYATFWEIREILFEAFPRLRVAYNLKELYIKFNQENTKEQAAACFDEVRQMFADSSISEYDEFVTLLTNWKQEIVNSFTIIYDRRINNSYIEAKNRQMERLMYNANGFSNFERTRNRILYCLNKYSRYTL